MVEFIETSSFGVAVITFGKAPSNWWKDSTDLKILIQRWTKTETRPNWKVIKLFMNEDLLPDNNLVYQLFPDISEKEQYLTFRRKIFSSYFITNLFVLNQKQDE